MFAEERFGFEQFELHPQRAVFFALKKVDVDLGELVAGRLEDCQPVGGDFFRERERGLVECVGHREFSVVDRRVVDLARGIVRRGRDLADDGFVGNVRGFPADQFGGGMFVVFLIVALRHRFDFSTCRFPGDERLPGR